MADITWARISPLLASVTPRSRYVKNSRRPGTNGAVSFVAWRSFMAGFSVAWTVADMWDLL
jgi:hypothetical protein